MPATLQEEIELSFVIPYNSSLEIRRNSCPPSIYDSMGNNSCGNRREEEDERLQKCYHSKRIKYIAASALLAFFIIGVLLFVFSKHIFSGDENSPRTISYNNSHTTSTNGFQSNAESPSGPHKHDGGTKLTGLSGTIENFFLAGKKDYELVRTNETMQSCEQYLHAGYTVSGVYTFHLPSVGTFPALCLMTSDNSSAWTVLQRRTGPTLPFWNATFEQYSEGFGDSKSDHWLGLDRLHAFFAAAGEQRNMILRILIYGDSCLRKPRAANHMQRIQQTACSERGEDGFWWGDWAFSLSGKDNGYQLMELKYIRGNLSKMGHDTFAKENRGMRFTAIGRDNDQHNKFNCAELHRKGGWWHKACTSVSLNGEYTTENSRAKGQSFLRFGDGARERAGEFYNIKPINSLMMFQ
ncbi:fibrinogen C domain-containing protein 1 [Ditylenchus destructor]|nr:fibrinogen C domain-containing protein 1 [Ditylenchus destructor]